MPDSSQYPEEMTGESAKSPGQPGRPLQGRPAWGTLTNSPAPAAGLPDGSGPIILDQCSREVPL